MMAWPDCVRRTGCLIAIAISLLSTLTANVACLGCDTPVYRYALEHWAAADYELVLIEAAALNEQEQATWKQLQELAGRSPAPNVRLRVTTPEQLADPASQALLASLGEL